MNIHHVEQVGHDADRLREAADLIGSVEVSEWSDDCYVPTPFARATAALLRAVADEATVCQCRSSYYRQPCQKHEEANETLAAALTLADVILGAES